LEEENKDMLEAYKKTALKAYERSMKRHFLPSRPNLCVIKIEPKRVTMLVQGETAAESYMNVINVELEEAHRIFNNIGDNMESPIYQKST
jgi:hypothetical protein